jgi:hypothetical protein
MAVQKQAEDRSPGAAGDARATAVGAQGFAPAAPAAPSAPAPHRSRSREEWVQGTLWPAQERTPQRQARFETSSVPDLEATYTPEDLAGWDYATRLGYPGEYPYTRGIQPTMYRGRLWTMRQYAGYASAEESNARYRLLLERGTTGLSVAFDLPTQMGYDSDHPLAQPEVGKVGVAIDSLEDMAALFDGIPLERVSTSMTINATAPIRWRFTWRSANAGGWLPISSPGRSRTTSSRSTSPAAPTSTRPGRRCG